MIDETKAHQHVPRAARDGVAAVFDLPREHDGMAGGGSVDGTAEAAKVGAAAGVLARVGERDREGE